MTDRTISIWNKANGKNFIREIQGKFFRLVESQEQVATSKIVSSLEKQALLEDLLEESKPKLRAKTQKLHYLLSTPFRYPPLKHGSRFGSRLELSLLYGGLSRDAVFAESAYYRFLFVSAIVADISRFVTEHTFFEASYQTKKGIQLQSEPFNTYKTKLISKDKYHHTQKLGSEMRAEGIHAFEYQSARCLNQTLNIGIFDPEALKSSKPNDQEQWICETTPSSVKFYSHHIGEKFHYVKDDFLVQGKLPFAAF
jgi:hypothetical protein